MAQSQFAAISASQGAGPAHAVALYTHTDMYQRAATLGDIQARQLASSLSLHKAVQDTLRASVMGSHSSAQQISRNAVAMNSGMREHVLSYITDPEERQKAIATIAEYAEDMCNDMIIEINDGIDNELQPTNFKNIYNTFNSHNKEMQVVFDQIEKDRVNRIARGGSTARAQRELRAMDAQRVFSEEGTSLTPYLTSRTKLVQALQKTQLEGIAELADGSIDVMALVNGSDDKIEKAINSKLVAVDQAITQIYVVNLGVFSNNKSNGGSNSNNSKDLIIPQHMEKGKAEEFGANLCSYTRNNLDRFFVIHRYVKRIVHEMGDGTFWKPPIKSKGFDGVLPHELADYTKQSAELYNELKKRVHKEIFDTLTSPKPSGFYGEINVWTEVDDGVLSVWVMMMRFFPNNNAYCNKLKKFMTDTPLLVHNPGANIRKVCDEITPPLKEIMKLGIRIPWSSSGLAFIETLTNAKARFTPYLHPLRHDVADPEDSAHNFQFLIARIESALNDFKSPTHSQAPELLAYEANYLENGSDDTHYVTYSEGGSDEGWDIAKYESNGYEGNETQIDSNCQEFHDAFEYPTDDFSEYYDANEGEVPIFQSNLDYQAYQTTKGGKGKNGGKTHGGFKGKSKGGRGSFGKNNYPSQPYGSARPYGRPQGGGRGWHVRDPTKDPFEANEVTSRKCAAKGCSTPANAAFLFCYACHQKGKEQGYLVDKSNQKITIAAAGKGGGDQPHQKRAYEAFCDTLSPEQKRLLKEGESPPDTGMHAHSAIAEGEDKESLIKRLKYAVGNGIN
jgi:hypothetical protein